jgi:succinate-semialdehyde dehydrogenase/glutarate-semialdehyde dehydrogenase
MVDLRESKLFLAESWTDGAAEPVTLHDRYTDEPLALVHNASREQVGTATRAVAASQADGALAASDRAGILHEAARLLAADVDAVAATIVAEGGFTVSDSRREVLRAVQTLHLCAEEANRSTGEMVPLQSSPAAIRRLAFTVRYPLGVVAAITPFNSPLNTVLHKVGPAIAAGNGVVLKPSAYTPLTAERLVRLLLDAGLPAGYIALLHGSGAEVGQWLLEDPVPNFYAFTGSTAVGEQIHRTIGLRKCQLEMGSLSSVIVCDDADLDDAAPKCLDAAFRKSGQICTSIQRLYLHRSIAAAFTEKFVGLLEGRVAGDPRDHNTFIGPLISRDAAQRVERWIEDAVAKGATVLAGGTRTDSLVQPTVLADVDPTTQVMCQEVFGPVVSLRVFDDLSDALAEANGTAFGLAAGIFTSDLNKAMTATRVLRMGSVHVNETSNGRLDLMPYTGAKASGMGKEGPRYAIEEMTEERLVTLRWS